MSNNCTPLYVLSAIACKLSECLSPEELEILSADLITLGEMLDSILARQSALSAAACKAKCAGTD